MDGLTVTVESTNATGLAIVRCEGEIDLSTCDELRSALEAVTASKPPALRLDLIETRFLDSAGVACLLHANDDCLAAGVRFFVVLAADSPIVRLFLLAGVASRIETIIAEKTGAAPVERPLNRPASPARTEFLTAVRDALEDQLSSEPSRIEPAS